MVEQAVVMGWCQYILWGQVLESMVAPAGLGALPLLLGSDDFGVFPLTQ